MSIDTQWMYRNTAVPSQTFEAPNDFFDSLYTGSNDLEVVQAHKSNNDKYLIDWDSYLLGDKRTVITLRRFENFNHYTEWKKFRSLLPKLDFNVSEQEGFFLDTMSGNYEWYKTTTPEMDYRTWDRSGKIWDGLKRLQEEEYY